MIRIGHGYDIHRFETTETTSKRDYLILAGVKIPHHCGIVAHSDGDVIIHALCDAILGAAALGDIGQHYPDSHSEYQNVASKFFLTEILALVAAMGYTIGNIDISVIAEKPKLAPYIAAMRQCLAEYCQITVSQLNIKATTHEGLDDIGQGLGIAVHAVVLLIKNND